MAEKYSGGYILLCIERNTCVVIVMFPMSTSQAYFVCVTLAANLSRWMGVLSFDSVVISRCITHIIVDKTVILLL